MQWLKKNLLDLQKKKLKNSNIKTSERLKNIKESDHCLEIIETKQNIYD